MKQILCYGDSNTWGLIPGTKERYPWGVRWTSILQEKLGRDIRIIEEGLCGRTTAFEDATRENRNTLRTLPMLLESHSPLDMAVFMLGTNDCKYCYDLTPAQIAEAAGQCVDLLLKMIPGQQILLVSPIYLGRLVWKSEYDPEFNVCSVEVSRQLRDEFKKLAERKHVRFLAASDYAAPSETDYEHLTAEGHAALAEAIYECLVLMNREYEKTVFPRKSGNASDNRIENTESV